MNPRALLVVTAVCSLCGRVWATQGAAPTPVMGWNSWGNFGLEVSETLITKTADRIVSLGLKDLGYRMVGIDDGWSVEERDENDRLQANPDRFPSGLEALSNRMTQKGLKLGLYTDIGKRTCGGLPGSYGHWATDAETFKAWNISLIKVDFCHRAAGELEEPWKFYKDFGDAFKASSHEIVFSLCEWGWLKPERWARSVGGNMWRVTQDVFPAWKSISTILDDYKSRSLQNFAGPDGWNDPDLLMVGVNGSLFNKGQIKSALTRDESATQFNLWSITNAPLILSLDLVNAEQWAIDIISNKAVIGLNQDTKSVGRVVQESKKGALFRGNCVVGSCSFVQVWAKELTGGDVAVVAVNRAGGVSDSQKGFKDEEVIQMDPRQLGLDASDVVTVTDLESGTVTTVNASDLRSKALRPHESQVLRISLSS